MADADQTQRMAGEAVHAGGAVGLVLRVEGAVELAITLVLYQHLGGGWLMFAVLFFAPDLAMVGYLRGPRLGASLYNAAHTYAAPATLALVGWVVSAEALLPLALIWAAHIGFDRMLGYGLKYPTAFGDTHLGRQGRPSRTF